MSEKTLALSNQALAGLGVYLGFKAAFRRTEMTSVGIDYEHVVAELTEKGIIRNLRINRKIGIEVWKTYFPHTLPSQTHQYMRGLGFIRQYY